MMIEQKEVYMQSRGCDVYLQMMHMLRISRALKMRHYRRIPESIANKTQED